MGYSLTHHWAVVMGGQWSLGHASRSLWSQLTVLKCCILKYLFFCKVVRQQIWERCYNSLSSALLNLTAKNYETWSTLAEVIVQEAQLMLTNPRDAFRGQSRSPNIVPFHMLGIVSSCAIVTLSLTRAVFLIFDFKKCCDLEIRVRGHLRSLKVVSFDRLHIVSY